ncbi:hypothetical protein M378DRAFT_67848 [Amanita muscaria Koide BX008]|uniref:Peptide hydrolase n=1 Tax=Amanita muscaria (strain Koide BX008) TaxID=946122 RepID=A0A0C2X7G8_AMAMK|nr:hypothetical protein M378DRAFT_67848 [Amanita muscaria Koide BX008]
MIPVAALGLFLILPFNSQIQHSSPCLSANFHGNYRDGRDIRSVFSFSTDQRDQHCFYSLGVSLAERDAYKIETVYEPQQLVWLELQEVDASLKSQNSFDVKNWITALHDRDSSEFVYADYQTPFQPLTVDQPIIWQSDKAALLSVDQRFASTLDQHLPRFWKSTLLPSSPIVHHAVPTSSVEHIQYILSQIGFDPAVASIVNNMSISQMERDIQFLTGEDSASPLVSRHSFTPGAIVAAEWLKHQFEETGAKCELKAFLAGFAPNVICRYRALEETNSSIILGAHYDSRGSFGFVRAPGGDDDGSGTISLLAIARTIARKGVIFRSNVELVAFAGEEQGLLGSRAYAKYLREKGANVTLMIQADMLAYRAYQEPPQLGIPDLIGSPIAAELVTKIATIYSPELQVGLTPACCSDHQSFHEQGYVATQVFERAGPIMDPMYHNSGDISNREGYDFNQVRSIAKFATLLHTAGYVIA